MTALAYVVGGIAFALLIGLSFTLAALEDWREEDELNE